MPERGEHAYPTEMLFICALYFCVLVLDGRSVMKKTFYDAIAENPIIAAIKDDDGLKACCNCEDVKIVFVLYGDICSIGDVVKKLKEAGKTAIVHVDLISGLGTKEIVIDFIKNSTRVDGIITTRPAFVKRAKELGLYTVLRHFMIDSMALQNINQSQYNVKPDFLEILPGAMPKMIKKICQMTKIPVIAGGLIIDKEDVMGALAAGAVSVSTTNQDVWKM